MESYNFNSTKDFVIVANKTLTRKVYPLVKPGDLVVVSGSDASGFEYHELVLITCNEEQWLERFRYTLPRRYKSISKISKIVIR